MPSSISLRDRTAAVRAALVGVAYLLAFQVAFLVMPFTSEALWLWPLGLTEAFGRGLEGVVAFFTGGEWLLAFVIPIAVFVLGFAAAYSYLVDRNPVPAVIAGGFLAVFYLTEVVFAGQFEYAILYLAAIPVAALLAVAGHLLSSQRRTAVAS